MQESTTAERTPVRWPPPSDVPFIQARCSVEPGKIWEIVFPRDCPELGTRLFQACALNLWVDTSWDTDRVAIVDSLLVQTFTVNGQPVHPMLLENPDMKSPIGMWARYWSGPCIEPGYIFGGDYPLRIAGKYDGDATTFPAATLSATIYGRFVEDLATYKPFKGGEPCW